MLTRIPAECSLAVLFDRLPPHGKLVSRCNVAPFFGTAVAIVDLSVGNTRVYVKPLGSVAAWLTPAYVAIDTLSSISILS